MKILIRTRLITLSLPAHMRSLLGHSTPVATLCFSADFFYLAAVSGTGNLIFVNDSFDLEGISPSVLPSLERKRQNYRCRVLYRITAGFANMIGMLPLDRAPREFRGLCHHVFLRYV